MALIAVCWQLQHSSLGHLDQMRVRATGYASQQFGACPKPG